MTQQDKAVVFNAIPLLALAAAYLAVAFALLPALWRERSRATVSELALALMFPCVGVPALIFGAVILNDREPIGNQIWLSFAGILIALLPALIFLARLRERALIATGGVRARKADERVSVPDREFGAVAEITKALARTQDVESAGRILLDEASKVLGVEFAALALITPDGKRATGLIGRLEGGEVDWWRGVRLDLEREPSGIASAFHQAVPVAVYDIESSSIVSRRLADRLGARSAAFVPLLADERVIGVLVAATTRERRVFGTEELALMEALAAEAALALERNRSASALSQAVEREQIVAQISRKVRSELDLDAVMRVAVTEAARAVDVARCFIRLGRLGEELPMAAEWHAEGLEPISPEAARRLPASNLAVRERRTVAIGEVEHAPELDDPELGSRDVLLALGTRAVLATPIVVFDRLIGVVGMHRTDPSAWSDAEVALAESVAGEIGLAIHTAGLLEENERRLGEQAALLKAAQVVTSELRLRTVLERLVSEVATLLGADAADCYLLEPERGVLRCAAVYGLSPAVLGFEFGADRGLAGRAKRTGRPVRSDDYAEIQAEIPHSAYEGFTGGLVAPMTWGGEVRGVLGAGTRDPARTFTETDADLLEAFAGLASLALRNAESFEQSARQARIQSGFYLIASALGEPVSRSETLDAVARAASEALGGSAAGVLMPVGERLFLEASVELPSELAEALRQGLGEDDGALVGAAQAGRVLSASVLEGDERFGAEWRGRADAVGFRSLLAIPVEGSRGEQTGLVIVFFDEQRHFADDDLELARQLVRAANAALERSALFEAERRSRALAQQLARTGSLLATELDPEAVLDEVVEQAPALLGADACSIRLLEGDELVVSAAVGEGADAAVGSHTSSTGSLAGDIAQSRLPVAVADVASDRRVIESDPILAAGHAAFLGVPLVGPEGVLHGVLAVYDRNARTWREEEIEALGALAANASAALSNAELYQRVAVEKERSVAILANIADGIVAVDRDGKLVLWNDAAERITGVPTGEALDRTPEQVLGRELQSDGEAPPGDRLVAIRRGDEEVWLSLTEAVMRDPAGLVAGRIFAFRDISTERMVDQMKSTFVSTVSHELRTPLTSIYGFAETLLREDVLFGDEERRTFLGYISSESERLTRIVDQLLNVTRLETGDLQVHVGPTDIREVVQEAVTTAEQALPVNGHSFVVELPAEPLDAQADAEKLKQILGNLLDNAVRYSPSGGQVTVGARRHSDSVEIHVDDEGVGIPQIEQERIFTKFYRADSGAARSGGTGLGLFIARGLVVAMGGRIRVSSKEGEGSSFVVELPVAAGAPDGSES